MGIIFYKFKQEDYILMSGEEVIELASRMMKGMKDGSTGDGKEKIKGRKSFKKTKSYPCDGVNYFVKKNRNDSNGMRNIDNSLCAFSCCKYILFR